MSSSRNLSVFLGDYFVGTLVQFFHDGRILMLFGDKYSSDPNRPILSLSYKNVLKELHTKVVPPSIGLPPFFSNLLPEGRLRKYLAQKAGVKETQEFKLLVALKDDLPGAVRIEDDPASDIELENVKDAETPTLASAEHFRYSLAGVQLKFSGNLKDSRLTIPAQGVGGHWIAKLPWPGYPEIVELEYAMLQLAQHIGINVPRFQVIPIEHIENLPNDIPEALLGDCLLSERFDRTDTGRIHIEDFAQVYNQIDKYNPAFNYQSIAQVLWLEIGLDAIQEYVRRLVHMVVTGNADMHLKNWSLRYPDGRHPEIAPAYDLISTIVYPDISKTLPHKIAGVGQFNKIESDVFKKFAEIAKLPKSAVLNTVTETVDAIRDQWPKLAIDLPIRQSTKRLIEEHMATVPIFYERPIVISTSVPLPPGLTWPAWFLKYDIELDKNVSARKIVYKNQQDISVELDSPRRMTKLLLQKQAHQLVAQHPQFANQSIVGYVGEPLYDEWRSETFIRIQSRLVEGGFEENLLRQPELELTAAFFPIDWRNIKSRYDGENDFFTMDFVLNNGELWTAQCKLISLDELGLRPNGTRAAKIHVYIQQPRMILQFPADQHYTKVQII